MTTIAQLIAALEASQRALGPDAPVRLRLREVAEVDGGITGRIASGVQLVSLGDLLLRGADGCAELVGHGCDGRSAEVGTPAVPEGRQPGSAGCAPSPAGRVSAIRLRSLRRGLEDEPAEPAGPAPDGGGCATRS